MRGYRRRNRLQHQLLAEVVYAATYTMRDPKGKTVTDLFPSLFQNDEDDEPPITEEEQQELQAEMEAINAQLAEKSE